MFRFPDFQLVSSGPSLFLLWIKYLDNNLRFWHLLQRLYGTLSSISSKELYLGCWVRGVQVQDDAKVRPRTAWGGECSAVLTQCSADPRHSWPWSISPSLSIPKFTLLYLVIMQLISVQTHLNENTSMFILPPPFWNQTLATFGCLQWKVINVRHAV